MSNNGLLNFGAGMRNLKLHSTRICDKCLDILPAMRREFDNDD